MKHCNFKGRNKVLLGLTTSFGFLRFEIVFDVSISRTVLIGPFDCLATATYTHSSIGIL